MIKSVLKMLVLLSSLRGTEADGSCFCYDRWRSNRFLSFFANNEGKIHSLTLLSCHQLDDRISSFPVCFKSITVAPSIPIFFLNTQRTSLCHECQGRRVIVRLNKLL